MSRLPRISPPVLWGGLLAALALLFMSPALIPSPGRILGGLDVHGLFLPWWSAARESVLTGRLPLWDPNQFGGYPFLANPQVAFFYPPTWIALILPPRIGISLYVVFHLWIAGMGMLLLVRALSRSWDGAALASVAYAFSGFTAARIFAGHIGLLATNAWAPWLLLGSVWSVRRGDGRSAVLAGLPLGLAILAGHTPSLIYLGIAWAAMVTYLAATTPRAAGSGRAPMLVLRQAAIAVAVGLALSAVQMLPFLEFVRASSRTAAPSLEFATQFSLPPAHLITLLVPEFFGEPVRAGYWSVPAFEELTIYAGVLPLLALIAGLRRPSPLTGLYVGLSGLGILIALGGYGFLYSLLYRLLPPFQLARAPGRAAFLYVLAASALLGEVVASWDRPGGGGHKAGQLVRRAGIVAGVASLAGLAAAGAIFVLQHPSDTGGRLWHQLGGWAMAALFLFVGGELLGRLAAAEQGARSKRFVLGGLIALMVIDLWSFGFKLVRQQPDSPAALWTEAAAIIGETGSRVLPWGVSIFEQNGAGEVGLQSVFGYNALEVAANQAFMASVPDPRSTAYDILGVAYVISGGPLDAFAVGDHSLELVGSSPSAWAYRRERPLSIARLAYEVEVIPDADAARARVHEPGFDPAATVILSDIPPCTPGPAPAAVQGGSRVVASAPGYWRVAVISPVPSLLVLAETAYPGWRVTIDGEAARPLTAYTAVHAVCVPAGEHTVEWIYRPLTFPIGGAISMAALVLVGWSAARRRRQPGSSI